ncbi:hypothetical protein ACH4CC_35730 [Streptomyces lydicus]|uniref:hypothetical protein n=1 Tax=Streptomyces lydicus TaxID=47763 RepID=UPI0037B2A1A2
MLTAVRGFLAYAVGRKAVAAWVLDQLYELGSEADLPPAARGESDTMRVRLRARHRLDEPESGIAVLSDLLLAAPRSGSGARLVLCSPVRLGAKVLRRHLGHPQSGRPAAGVSAATNFSSLFPAGCLRVEGFRRLVERVDEATSRLTRRS